MVGGGDEKDKFIRREDVLFNSMSPDCSIFDLFVAEIFDGRMYMVSLNALSHML